MRRKPDPALDAHVQACLDAVAAGKALGLDARRDGSDDGLAQACSRRYADPDVRAMFLIGYRAGLQPLDHPEAPGRAKIG
jgi:hypothetical protein